MAIAYPINPLSLLGKTFDFVELCPGDYGPDIDRFHARVLAVVVPAPDTDVECSLLLLQDGYPEPEYHDLSVLHFDS